MLHSIGGTASEHRYTTHPLLVVEVYGAAVLFKITDCPLFFFFFLEKTRDSIKDPIKDPIKGTGS